LYNGQKTTSYQQYNGDKVSTID